MRALKRLLGVAFLLGGLAACEDGTFEKAGRSMDKAAEKVEDKLEDAAK
jgi:hypothetical protein